MGSIIEYIYRAKKWYSSHKPKKYKIVHTEMGYLPLYHDGRAWRAVNNEGGLSVHADCAIEYQYLFKGTEAEAGEVINRRARFLNDSKTVWSA